jgi:PAS domain S-box-containing protein
MKPGARQGRRQRLIQYNSRDSRERQRLQEMVRASEERFRITADTANDLVYEWDLKQSVQWPGKIDELLGYGPGEFPRTLDGWAASLHPEDLDRVMGAIQAHLEGGAPYAVEFRIRRKDGAYRWCSARGAAARRPDGEPTRIIGSMTDITGRKEAEETGQKLNAELERRVRDRTAQLEAANRELEAFSYSVSHDLRAPLRHIGAFANLLVKASDPGLSDKSRHYLEEILDSVKQMGCLIDDLLLFSRMGRAGLKPAPVNLERLVEEAKKQLEPESKGREIRWKQGALPALQGDGALLRQVMLNLLSNALKYSRPRQPAEIEIGCDSSHPGETVVFVRDNGVGFDMEYAGKLFRVFQRLHLNEEFEGTGIGLATVRRIIARHGGRTWAEGKVNAGATFYFSLPKTPSSTQEA